ncbi:cyclin-D3-1 [Malania oleifera]|uniref:cyclin-D3-1 n=1 Tax=Malania oleifera TaxID=397392 RepID=UPI0025AE8C54|nr:cyclin-D3-1 [Malania oleifera]
MAIQQEQQISSSLLLDALYCEEEKWEEEEVMGAGLQVEIDEKCSHGDDNGNGYGNGTSNPSLLPLFLLEQDLFWEDEELVTLFAKEQQQKPQTHLINATIDAETDSALSIARHEAVLWALKVNAHYGFSALTAILAINYLDRFLSSLHFQRDKPWMIQLAAVTCLSLAAKVEETQVPFLLDFQVEETKYVFEAKTIQRMELLVLSTLQWKMNPVTPLSFLDHIIRRLGLKHHIHWEFLRRCEHLLLSVVADCRFGRYLPSVLAAAAMMHVIEQVEPCNAIDYQNQLMGVLKISKEEANECYELIKELSEDSVSRGQKNTIKRKYSHINAPGSPSGVIDRCFSSDCSNDSWAVSSSPEPVLKKKSRTAHQQQHMTFPSLNRVFVDVLGSPP